MPCGPVGTVIDPSARSEPIGSVKCDRDSFPPPSPKAKMDSQPHSPTHPHASHAYPLQCTGASLMTLLLIFVMTFGSGLGQNHSPISSSSPIYLDASSRLPPTLAWSQTNGLILVPERALPRAPFCSFAVDPNLVLRDGDVRRLTIQGGRIHQVGTENECNMGDESRTRHGNFNDVINLVQSGSVASRCEPKIMGKLRTGNSSDLVPIYPSYCSEIILFNNVLVIPMAKQFSTIVGCVERCDLFGCQARGMMLDSNWPLLTKALFSLVEPLPLSGETVASKSDWPTVAKKAKFLAKRHLTDLN